MAIQYIFGAAGAGKSWYLYQGLRREAKEHPEKNYLVIVPEQFTLQTQKELVTLMPEQCGIMNIDVLSFLRLAWKVFEETGGNERLVLEDTGKSMIVKKIAQEKQEELRLFRRNVRKQGFLDEIKSVLSEFYQYGIGEEELEQMLTAAKGNAMLEKKLSDLAVFYRGFQDFLADRYITTEGICDLLREKVPESSLIAGCTLCLDGFTGFTPSQYKLLGVLLKYAQDVRVTLTMDASQVFRPQKEHQLFYLSYVTMQHMDELAVQNGQEIAEPVVLQEIGRYGATESLKHLEKQLFRYPFTPYKKEQKDLRLFTHKGLPEEVNWTVTEISQLVRARGYRYRDIAVVAGDLESYAEELKREFDRAGIPCFIDRKKTVLDNPLVTFINAALELAAQDFTYDAVFQYLKSPLSGITPEEGDVFENYVLAVGIRRYRSYCKEWKYRYRTRYAVSLEEINATRQKLLEPLQQFYEVMRSETTVREKVTALYSLLVTQGAERYLEKQAADLQEKEPLRAREYEQIYRLVLELFDRIVGLLGEDVLSLKEFQEILKTGFAEAKVGLIPPGLDQVVAGDIERTRLKDVKVLFFLGVNEGVVPKPVKGGGILSEMDRMVFEEQGIELAPGRRKSAFTAEFYLYLTLTKPTEKLFLSWRRTDASGKALLPSYLIDRVRKLFPLAEVEERQETKLYSCLGTDAGFGYFIRGLQEYIHSDAKAENIYFEELCRLYMTSEKLEGAGAQVLQPETIAAAAFYQKNVQPLSRENARRLYGAQLKGSVSRLERYAECAFAHFLGYGLSLEERREYQIAMPDIGTLYHNALQLYSQKLKEGAYRWHTVEAAVSEQLLKEAIVQAAEEYENGIFSSTKRNEYLLQRMERMLKRTIATVQSQIAAGDFEPAVFEYAFAHADRYLALRGRIDRIDVCEKDGKAYIRVVDYKSGNNLFRLDKLYYGLQLQLSVYLKAALAWARETHTETVVPAGMLYYHIDDPVVEKEEAIADYEAAVRMQLAMHGLVNADTGVIVSMDRHFYDAAGGLAAGVKSAVVPVETGKTGALGSRSLTASTERMEQLLEVVNEKLHIQSAEVQEGNIEPNPYRMGQENACTWCAYRGACGFDTGIPGYHYRNLSRMRTEEAWEKLMEEKDGEAAQEGNRTEG
ncbi:MAG: helicase-exonuclease AddAB subunit AddB [Lachnospiraceae bacterium]|nr:helicase-exonuclease AddAB subunit AddB [Lachnospiraceae bacterium]